MNTNHWTRFLLAAGLVFLVSAACVTMPMLPRTILFDRDLPPTSPPPTAVRGHYIEGPLPTPTIPPGPIPVAGPRESTCNVAKFIEDVTIPDGTDVLPGSEFNKTWKIQNVGTCTWTRDFTLAYVDGAAMGVTSVKLGIGVRPTETIHVTVTRLKAPIQPGNYRANWTLKDEQGRAFSQRLVIDIDVVTEHTPAPAPRIRYDFAAHYCDARWMSSSNQILGCPGVEGGAHGFVLQVQQPALEHDFTDNAPGLLTYPEAQADGTIAGWFPPVVIENGDHFRALLGCEKDAKTCNVRFELSATVGDGQIIPLGSWNETYDNQYTSVDLDLSSLAGKSASFYLIVYANGDSTGDRALWLHPRILNP